MKGTNNFISLEAAVEYYKQYYTESNIKAKIDKGNIVIGRPEIKSNEKLIVLNGRYHISN